MACQLARLLRTEIVGLAEGLLNALPQLMEALPQIIMTIINFITNNLPAIIVMGIELTVQRI